MGSFDKLVLWLFGDRQKARDVAEKHLTAVSANLPTSLEGDGQDAMDGMLYGGVIWPVEPGTHGAKAFLTSWSFLAYYDGQKEQAWMLDDLDGTRHPGARPLTIGKDLKVTGDKKQSGLGFVLRSAEEGADGQVKNVFMRFRADLIAHHLPPNQPDNSSLVGDPDATDERQGGLHYPFRVREWVRRFCSGATQAAQKKLFAPLLNMRLKNGDGTDAAGGATFARGEAALSDEAKGPLACANDGFHRLGVTGEATIHQGALHIDSLYGPVSDNLYMPEEIIDVPWEPGTKGPFIKRVEKRPDLTAKHRNFCGKEVPGQIKWQTWDTFREYPPTIKEPPPDEPKKPVPDPRYPAMLVPPETGIPPTTGTPYEIESPSQYGHPMPDLPDGPPPAVGGIPNSANDNYADAFWMNRFGVTESDWHKVPVASHRFTLPEYSFSAAKDIGERWPTVKDTHELVTFDDAGQVKERIAATGPGVVVEAPAWARPWHVFRGLFQKSWRASRHLFLIFAGKSDDGTVVDGKGGIGAVTPGVQNVVSGWQWQLDFTDSATEPHINFTKRDALGANAGAGEFRVNGIAVGTGTGDVVGPASATDNAIARYDTTTGKLIQNSGVVIDDPSSSTIRIHTGAAAHILITPDTSLSSGTFDTTVDAGGTGSTTLNLGTVAANAVAISRSGKNTAIGGTVSSDAHTITQPTLGSVVRTHQSTATNDDPGTTDRHDRTTATGDGTTVTLHTLTLATGKAYILSLKVLGTCTAADGEGGITVGETGGYHIRATVRNTGGTASIVAQTQDAQEDTNFSGATVVLDATGATIRVRVTSPNVGDGTSTYVWHMAECVMSNPVGS